jgi:ribosomal protein S18 acetylase RimI-like enzyme
MTPLALQIATVDEAGEIAEFRNEVACHMAMIWGTNAPSLTTDKGVLSAMKTGDIYIARQNNKIIASLTFTLKKPWAIDRSYFKPSVKPLYLLSMAVAPDMQSQGIGRRVLDIACDIAKQLGSDAIRLDAFDKESGAGEFYRKCGFTEVGRARYREAALIYYERLLLGDERST